MAAKPVIYDDDAPELSDAELAEFRPAREVMSEADFEAAAAVRKGRPKSESKKISVTIRLDPEVVAALRATGRNWQTRANTTLAQSVGITLATPKKRRRSKVDLQMDKPAEAASGRSKKVA